MGSPGGTWRMRSPPVAFALVLSMFTYPLLEEPVCRSRLPGAPTVEIGVAMTAAPIGVPSIVVACHPWALSGGGCAAREAECQGPCIGENDVPWVAGALPRQARGSGVTNR